MIVHSTLANYPKIACFQNANNNKSASDWLVVFSFLKTCHLSKLMALAHQSPSISRRCLLLPAHPANAERASSFNSFGNYLNSILRCLSFARVRHTFHTIRMNCMTLFSQVHLAIETFPSYPDCTGCRLCLIKVASCRSENLKPNKAW
jgi:hypothetical protein